MRALREVIEAAKAGKRITLVEKITLARLLDLYWRAKCIRCRRVWPVDHLDERDGHCEECVEAVTRMGE